MVNRIGPPLGFAARESRLGLSVALVLGTFGLSCAREIHRRQGAVLVTGDAWGEIGPCG